MVSKTRLREIYGNPSPRAAAKVVSALDHHCRAFIENATFLVLATSDGSNMDVSPKGDPAGFVILEDNNHILLPDRPGNNRIDGLMNIVDCPKVAMIFMIPSVAETLRVNGTAAIHDEPDLLQKCAMNGRLPKTVLRIKVEEVFSHCGKAPIRAGLWKPETWPMKRPVATLNEIVRDHSGLDVGSVSQNAVDKLYRDLY